MKPNILLLVLVFWFHTDLSNGQNLFNLIHLQDSSLTAEQLNRKTLFSSDSSTMQLYLVTVESVFARQQNNLVGVFIPGDTMEYFFQGQIIELIDSSMYNWSGELVINKNGSAEMDTNRTGRILLCYRGSKVFGHLVIDSLDFSIRDLTGGLNALILKKELGDNEICFNGEGHGGFESNENTNSYDNDEGNPNRTRSICPVSVLICYTQAAFNKAPDLVDMVEMGMIITNNTVKRSKVGPTQLSFHVKGYHMIETNEWVETGSENDRFSIIDVPEIKTLRDNLKADIVIVLTDDIYPLFTGAVSAIYCNAATSKDSAYALVTYNTIGGGVLTFPHEIFHLFGARHELTSVCGAGVTNFSYCSVSWAHGWAFPLKNDGNSKKNTVRTMMAFCGNLFPRIEYLSNPDNKYKKWKTGDTQDANNARIVGNHACDVADYYSSDDIPLAVIYAESEGCYHQYHFFYGEVHGPIPSPYTYIWRYSNNGVDWSNPVTTSGDYEVYLDFEPGSYLHIELTAGNINGPLSKAYKSVLILPNDHHCQHNPQFISSEKTLTNDDDAFDIYPNPSDGILNIKEKNENYSLYNIAIEDMFGRTVMRKTNCLGNSTLDGNFLNSGLYVVKINQLSNNKSIISQVIISK